MERVFIPIMAIMTPKSIECMVVSSTMQCQVMKAAMRVAKVRPVVTVNVRDDWKV